MIVAIANQKGGTGKTTSAVNLAACLALRRHAVLVVDCDPQANATTALGIDHTVLTRSLADVLTGTPIAACIVDVGSILSTPNAQDAHGTLHLLPAHHTALANAENSLNTEVGDQFLLREALTGIAEQYDVMLLDCPPSLSGLTISALIAADAVLIPAPCEFFALEGAAQLARTVSLIQARFNPSLRIIGVLPVTYDGRRVVTQVVLGMFEDAGMPLLASRIHATVRVTESQGAGRPLCTYDPRSRAAEDYAAAAIELEAMLCAQAS